VWKPGETNPMIKPGYTFASGPDHISQKNIGKGEVVTYTVTPKGK
jgi:hypothetical protein